MRHSSYDIAVRTIEGKEITLSEYEGKVIVVVNVASKCGLTPQYQGLESLYRDYREKGLVILGFPCNQFMGQEPGDEREISQFCSLNYDVTFPLFSKVEVNGKEAHPLYQYLKKSLPGILGTKDIKWNFTKFLIDGQGNPVKRFGPREDPLKMKADIDRLVIV